MIYPAWFFGALLLGMLYVMCVRPETTVVVKHPTPFNVDDVTHRNAAGECYKYVATKRRCPATGAVRYAVA